jgi:hypothetical protein
LACVGLRGERKQYADKISRDSTLGHERVGAGIHCAPAHGIGIVQRNDHDYGRSEQGFDASDGFDTADARHFQIHQHDIRPIGGDTSECKQTGFDAIADYEPRFIGNEIGDAFGNRGIVVDDHYAQTA